MTQMHQFSALRTILQRPDPIQGVLS